MKLVSKKMKPVLDWRVKKTRWVCAAVAQLREHGAAARG